MISLSVKSIQGDFEYKLHKNNKRYEFYSFCRNKIQASHHVLKLILYSNLEMSIVQLFCELFAVFHIRLWPDLYNIGWWITSSIVSRTDTRLASITSIPSYGGGFYLILSVSFTLSSSTSTIRNIRRINL